MGYKLTIELPDWADERHIFIMAGIEMVAYKLYGEDEIHIKTSRCHCCGECCMNLNPNSFPFPLGPEGHCIYLEEPVGGNRECGLGANRPFGCSTGMQRKGIVDHPNCSVDYK